MAATEDPSAEGSGEVEGTEGETMSEPAAGPSPATILIDLIVRFDGSEPLPGITVDIAQADPFEKTKASYRHWIETAGMFKRDTRQISFDLEVEDFQVGDVFSVVLESHVAAEDRGEYREFATPATPAP